MPWINQACLDPKHTHFIYLIKNLDTNELYIGKKQLTQRRYSHTTKRYIYSPSNWQNYQSSSQIVSKWNPDRIEKTILQGCFSAREATYLETSLLFKADALSEDTPFVNKNIGGKYFTHTAYKGTPLHY